jgi:hypothetical protein
VNNLRAYFWGGKVARENAVQIPKWICKTKTAIVSSQKKISLDPNFEHIIIVGHVETHRYSPFLGHGDHFWQSYEGNQVQKIRHTIHRTI